MTLATHIVIAGAAARTLGAAHPLAAFFVALASHYLSDAIPHWDYPLHSANRNPLLGAKELTYTRSGFAKDMRSAGFDAAIGTAVLAFFLPPTTLASWVWLGVVVLGAILPDGLQGVYVATKAQVLLPIQDFHDWWHTKIKLGPYPLIGIPLQLLIIGAALAFLL